MDSIIHRLHIYPLCEILYFRAIQGNIQVNWPKLFQAFSVRFTFICFHACLRSFNHTTSAHVKKVCILVILTATSKYSVLRESNVKRHESALYFWHRKSDNELHIYRFVKKVSELRHVALSRFKSTAKSAISSSVLRDLFPKMYHLYNNTGLYASWSLPSGVLRS